jgi:molecular chaperone HscB
LPADYFEFLGLDGKLAIDLRDLEQRYYKLSRTWHPDRFARGTEAEKQQALDNTALLNDAYRTLRDPIKRAEYVLSRAGLDVAHQSTKNVPPELLEEVFELNMALEELRSGDEEARPQLEQARERFLAMRAESDRELEEQFAAHDGGSAEAIASMRSILNRRNYIRNLVSEVEKTLNASD